MKDKKVVLIVDDEKSVRIHLTKNLSEEGYGVITAATISEAHEKIKILKQIDYAIVDLNFLGDPSVFGGTKVIANLNILHPSAIIIIISGYTDETFDGHKSIKYDSFISKGAPGNWVTNTINELEELKTKKPQKNCFVIMPFSETNTCSEDDWTAIFDLVITLAVKEAGYNYQCTRNDQYVGSIIKNIVENLKFSDLVIADLTDKNPNVFYELGVRHTFNTPTILISQNLEDIPSDLKGYMSIKYSLSPAGVDKFKADIKKAIKKIEDSNGKINYSPVGDFLH